MLEFMIRNKQLEIKWIGCNSFVFLLHSDASIMRK